MKLLKIIILVLITLNVRASGILPEPIITNDPHGNIDPDQLYDAVCGIVQERLFNGEKIEGVMGGIVIRGTEDLAGYTYYYYLQDIIDICIWMDSI